MFKKLKFIFCLLTIPALLLAGGLYFLLSASLPVENGMARLAGLTGPATVRADRLGVPSIEAANRNDVYRVLGFLHARDRMFQMDLMRRKGAGRLAEIFGAKAVEADRGQRDYQLERTATAIVAELPENQQAVLTAYAAGVNAYISATRILPPEFLLLNYSPEPWRAEDSILAALVMFQTLNGHEQDERMLSVMEKALPQPLTRFLTPDTDAYATVLIGGAESHRPAQPVPVNAFSALDTEDVASARGAVATESVIAGSNNWVVAGAKTVDGRAILANDMHLKLSAPNIWYRTNFSYPGHAFNGVTLPGLPLPIVGGNGRIAWGFTNATVDLLDLIFLEINPDNAQQYLTPQGWRNFDARAGVIKVKGGADVSIEPRSTIWGPVSSRLLLGRQVAIKWTPLETQAVDLGLLEMDHAASVLEAMPVANRAGGPPQNVVLADSAGHIGWTYMGRFPRRFGLDGAAAQSWADGAAGWDGFIAAEELPRLYDAPEGFIATANNRTLGRDYPYVLGYNWALGYRAYRIAELLRQNRALTEQDMLRIQLDTRCEIFEFYRNLALETLGRSSGAQPAADGVEQALRAWDGNMNGDSKGVALLTAFRSKLAEGVFAKVVARGKQYDPDFRYAWREMETPLRELLTQRAPGVLPARYRDDWDAFILQSLREANADLAGQHPHAGPERLTWGAVNRIAVAHPISGALPMLAAFLDIAEFDSDGCAGFCVKVLSNANGASERLALSPGHPEDGILEMPGGQSGHPLSG
ncbi:MAG: penicillin acylase family protein, partial [Methylomonas sp.]